MLRTENRRFDDESKMEHDNRESLKSHAFQAPPASAAPRVSRAVARQSSESATLFDHEVQEQDMQHVTHKRKLAEPAPSTRKSLRLAQQRVSLAAVANHNHEVRPLRGVGDVIAGVTEKVKDPMMRKRMFNSETYAAMTTDRGQSMDFGKNERRWADGARANRTEKRNGSGQYNWGSEMDDIAEIKHDLTLLQDGVSPSQFIMNEYHATDETKHLYVPFKHAGRNRSESVRLLEKGRGSNYAEARFMAHHRRV